MARFSSGVVEILAAEQTRRVPRGSKERRMPCARRGVTSKRTKRDRVILDKNARIGDGARLVNTRAVLNGNGFYIRNGIIIVPKDATIHAGFVV
jgi:hypothetical protein